MFLGGPDADRVVSQVVREHRDRALEVTLRVGSERGETRELVEDKRLTAILLGALKLLGGQQGRGDIGRDLRERIDVRLPVTLLL